jgi:N-methylhydantoinase A
LRIASDIGGTFTDLVRFDPGTGEMSTRKVSTTPRRFEQAVFAGLAKEDVDPRAIGFFVHGSTVVINALTERKGVSTGLITTEGFRDVLEIQRANRPDLYNMRYRKPEPFVPRRARLGVRERVTHRGEVVTPLDEDGVRRAVSRLRELGVEAVAICFLHAYANPDNERRALEIVRAEWPEVAATASHHVTREWREYERTSTVVLNAYVQPVAERYLGSLEQGLLARGCRGSRYVMHSSGGSATFRSARERPITMIESGPVAGVMGAAAVGRELGREDVISLDIGGTTAKCSLVEDGRLRLTTTYLLERTPRFAGYPLKVPVVDIVEIGAGGGSIARVDEAGALQVGPESAGAEPGPACYGRDGSLPTVTDANLVSGRMDPRFFLGGEMALDEAAAARALEPIARHFETDVDEAALGVLRVANANLTNALGLVSVQRGHDPREFALVASGGAGPMHATALARELQIREVIVPPAPGVFSAWAMLASDLRFDLIQTELLSTDDADPAEVERIFADLERQAREHFSRERLERWRVDVQRHVEMRYAGQEHTVRVPAPARFAGRAGLDELAERFAQLHEQQYTFRLEERSELVNFGITAVGAVDKPEPRPLEPGSGADSALRGERDMLLARGQRVTVPIYDRPSLGAGDSLSGPALLAEPTSTTVLLPGDNATVHEYGSLMVDVSDG